MQTVFHHIVVDFSEGAQHASFGGLDRVKRIENDNKGENHRDSRGNPKSQTFFFHNACYLMM
jgi:hypothetical protein